MDQPSQREWARKLCVEAFSEANVKLREGDSIILVAAVFRRALDCWLDDHAADLAEHKKMMKAIGETWQANVLAGLEEHVDSLREVLKNDARVADYTATQAVNKALSISVRESDWKLRAQGFFGGLGLFVLIFLMAKIL